MSHFLDGKTISPPDPVELQRLADDGCAIHPPEPEPAVVVGKPVRILYQNWRGCVRWRHVLLHPGTFRWAATEHHPEPQWVVDGVDLDTGDLRTFALAGVAEWRYEAEPGDQE